MTRVRKLALIAAGVAGTLVVVIVAVGTGGEDVKTGEDATGEVAGEVGDRRARDGGATTAGGGEKAAGGETQGGSRDGSAGGDEPGGGPSDAGRDSDFGEAPSADEGIDDSIETFGEPAGEADREAVERALRGYSTALAEDDHARACDDLAPSYREELIEFARGVSRIDGDDAGCGEMLERVASRMTDAERRGLRRITLRQVRIDGDRGFAIYRLSGRRLPHYSVVVHQDGKWGVRSVLGTPTPERRRSAWLWRVTEP